MGVTIRAFDVEMGRRAGWKCPRLERGDCDGVERVRCPSCGGRGHGNCYGVDMVTRIWRGGAIPVPCHHNWMVEGECWGLPEFTIAGPA